MSQFLCLKIKKHLAKLLLKHPPYLGIQKPRKRLKLLPLQHLVRLLTVKRKQSDVVASCRVYKQSVIHLCEFEHFGA